MEKTQRRHGTFIRSAPGRLVSRRDAYPVPGPRPVDGGTRGRGRPPPADGGTEWMALWQRQRAYCDGIWAP
eukprot:11196800-Lingulodinium_polyedra.AAC.1